MLYKEDWENELKNAEHQRDMHLKGYELMKDMCDFFHDKIGLTEGKPMEDEKKEE